MSDDLSIPNPGYQGNRVGRYGTGQSRARSGMAPDTRRLMIFAGGLGIVLIGLVGASMLIGHRSGEIPTVSADPRPIRIKPENPGGMKIDGAENDVFSGGSDVAGSKLAPPPENPDANAWRTSPASSPPPVAALPPVALAPPPVVTSAPITLAPSVSKPAAVASAPASKPASVVSTAPTAPPKASVPAAVEARSTASGQQATVQLAALTSETAARNEWLQLSKRMPELLSDRQPIFSRFEREGHTFWRVRTSGFTDTAQARTFCERVHAKGGGCSIADF